MTVFTATSPGPNVASGAFSSHYAAAAAANAQQHEEQKRQFFLHIFGLLCAMIACTWLVACTAMANVTIRNFMLASGEDRIYEILGGGGFLSFILLLILKENLRHKRQATRNDYILLAMFTLTESVVVSLPCAMLAQIGWSTIVIQSFGMTLALCAGLALFATQTRYKLTKWKGPGIVVMQTLFFYSIYNLIFGYQDDMTLVTIGALVFGLFVVIDIQSTMHTMEPGSANAILAVTKLYLDFMNIFIRILRILVDSKIKESRNKKGNNHNKVD